MSVRKNPNGSWTAVIKQRGRFVGSKTFRSKRDADAWEREQKHRLGAGINLAAGRVTVGERLRVWLADREGSVSEATHIADRDLLRILPPWFLTLRVNAVTEGHVERLLGEWARRRAHNSVRRYRAALSTFFASCLRARLVTSNPVQAVPIPRATKPPAEMSPFSEAELDEVVQAIRARSERLADVVLLLGWSGLRWGELRALRVGDFVHTRSPALRVQRSHSESRSLKGTKSSRSRIVPVADRLVPVLEDLARGKQATELLVTTERGAQLHRTAFIRATGWESLGRGRRIHDLRHTAICLWLLRGVEPLAVKSWAGHQSLATTNQYVHYLGTSADEAGIARLNAPRANLGQISREAIA